SRLRLFDGPTQEGPHNTRPRSIKYASSVIHYPFSPCHSHSPPLDRFRSDLRQGRDRPIIHRKSLVLCRPASVSRIYLLRDHRYLKCPENIIEEQVRQLPPARLSVHIGQ